MSLKHLVLSGQIKEQPPTALDNKHERKLDELAVLQPTKLELVINHPTAGMFGLTAPSASMCRRRCSPATTR